MSSRDGVSAASSETASVAAACGRYVFALVSPDVDTVLVPPNRA
jgi:hypothetical protein